MNGKVYATRLFLVLALVSFVLAALGVQPLDGWEIGWLGLAFLATGMVVAT